MEVTDLFSCFDMFHQTATVWWECQDRTGCWRTPMYLGTSGWTMILTTGIVSSPCWTPTIRWLKFMFECICHFVIPTHKWLLDSGTLANHTADTGVDVHILTGQSSKNAFWCFLLQSRAYQMAKSAWNKPAIWNAFGLYLLHFAGLFPVLHM